MTSENDAIVRRAGIVGAVNGYGVIINGDRLTITRDGERVARSTVDGLGRFIGAARDLRIGWGQFPDDAEVIYIYDREDDGFGYAVNLACDCCSEWGYAPFGR